MIRRWRSAATGWCGCVPAGSTPGNWPRRRDGMTLIHDRLASEPRRGGRVPSLALRYALRELRGGLRGFYVFIGCIALGVMAIAGVGSVAASLSEGLTRE